MLSFDHGVLSPLFVHCQFGSTGSELLEPEPTGNQRERYFRSGTLKIKI